MAQLRIFRDMTERHVRTALYDIKPIVASADPFEFITDSMIQEFVTQAGISWEEARGVLATIAGENLPVPIYDSVIKAAITRSVGEYHDLLGELISKSAFPAAREPIYGEFIKGNLVAFGDVRPLLVGIGGGTTEVTVPLVGGFTSGLTMRENLRANGIDTNKKIWLYGDQSRRVFNGHLQMDGLVFESWDDPGLDIAPQDAWLRRDKYQPGDHFGCACIVAPYFPNFGAPFDLNLSV